MQKKKGRGKRHPGKESRSFESFPVLKKSEYFSKLEFFLQVLGRINMESVSRYEGRGVRFTASVTDAKIKTWEGTGGREGGCNESSFSLPLAPGARYQDLGPILFSKY